MAVASRQRVRVAARRRLAGCEPLEPRQLLAVSVTTSADSGAGSLREAIDKVNGDKVANTITFENLGAATIKLSSALPTLTNPAGTVFAFGGTTTSVTLDGSEAPAGADGLTIGDGANGVSLNGLAITIMNFDSGLAVLGGSTGSTFKGLTLTGNADGIVLGGGTLTGTTIAGNTIALNTFSGVVSKSGVTGLTLGGTGAGNTVTNNDTGLLFQAGTYTGTVVAGNTVTNNQGDGIRLAAASGTLQGLTIGGSKAGAANTVSSNQDNGLEVDAGTFTGTTILGNTIASNDGFGIQLIPAGQTLSALAIGGANAGEGNTIQANAADGIGVFGGTFTGTTVQGNTIRYNQNGVSLNRQAAGAAFSGLLLGGSHTASTPAGNTITQNALDGVVVNSGAYTTTSIRGNTITANGRHGVNLVPTFGGTLSGMQLGGTTTGDGNTVTGNTVSGLAAAAGNYTDTVVLGNTFSGNAVGVSLADVANLSVGGTAAGSGNVLGTNSVAGVSASGALSGTSVRGNAFSANTVGLSLQDATNLAVGGSTAGSGNAVSGGTVGLRAVGTMSGTTISGNSFAGQTTGIHLVNARGASAATPFFVGGAAASPGTGAGNFVTATRHGFHAAGPLHNTTVAGNIFSASASGGNGMVLENATGLTVGGSAAGFGNTLTAARGNGLWAAGSLAGTGLYRNTLTASQQGAVLINATNLLFGVANNAALRNVVQYNRIGVRALGVCTGTGVCFTSWVGNTRKLFNSATGLVVTPKP